jgi:hypothetical protein
MATHDAGMFTVKEINRLKILQDVIDRNLRPGQAAEMLSITPRHCSRLLKRYRQSGPMGMNNQSRGRTGNSLTELALSIIRERYCTAQNSDDADEPLALFGCKPPINAAVKRGVGNSRHFPQFGRCNMRPGRNALCDLPFQSQINFIYQRYAPSLPGRQRSRDRMAERWESRGKKLS